MMWKILRLTKVAFEQMGFEIFAFMSDNINTTFLMTTTITIQLESFCLFSSKLVLPWHPISPDRLNTGTVQDGVRWDRENWKFIHSSYQTTYCEILGQRGCKSPNWDWLSWSSLTKTQYFRNGKHFPRVEWLACRLEDMTCRLDIAQKSIRGEDEVSVIVSRPTARRGTQWAPALKLMRMLLVEV